MVNVGGMPEERAILILKKHIADLEEMLPALPEDDERREDLTFALAYLQNDLKLRLHRQQEA